MKEFLSFQMKENVKKGSEAVKIRLSDDAPTAGLAAARNVPEVGISNYSWQLGASHTSAPITPT